MRFLNFLTVTVLSGLLLAGCASVVHVEKDETANLNSYRSYTWTETKTDSTAAPVSDLTERRIRQAVDEELAKAGWKVSKNKPDVLLSYDVTIDRGVKQDNRPVYSDSYTRYFYNPYSGRWNAIYYPSRFLGYDSRQLSVREGTVTISLIDARTEKTIWQGWTTDEVNSRNLTSKEIRSAVKNIFRKFDVAKN